VIETERLILRPVQLDDVEKVRVLVEDPEVMRFLGGLGDDPHDAVERWRARWDANGFGHFMLELRDGGGFVGRTGLTLWDPERWEPTTGEGQPEIGWTLAREHWGRGYATEAAHAVRDWARRERGVQRLISLVHPDNAPSARVAERLGARPTETVTLDDGEPAVVWLHP
jgi:RimJ/RimL family protein N-acetyltransferase